MFKRYARYLVLAVFMASGAAYAAPGADHIGANVQVAQEISGLDWLQLSLAGQLEYILI